MLQTLSFSGFRMINAFATFFRYESGSAAGADEAIRVRADGNDLGLYYPGDSLELPTQAGAWEIAPVSEGACTGVVRLGVGRVNSARLLGTVSVIDGQRAKTLAGQAFMFAGTKTPAAGRFARQGVWVPADSKKRVIVEAVRGKTAAPGVVWFASTSVAPGGLLPLGTRSKLLGGAATDGVNVVSTDSAFMSENVLLQWGGDAELVEWSPKSPLIVQPGRGLLAVCSVAGQALGLSMEIIVEPNV